MAGINKEQYKVTYISDKKPSLELSAILARLQAHAIILNNGKSKQAKGGKMERGKGVTASRLIQIALGSGQSGFFYGK